MKKPHQSRHNPIRAIRAEPLFKQRVVPNSVGKNRRDEKRRPVNLDDHLDD